MEGGTPSVGPLGGMWMQRGDFGLWNMHQSWWCRAAACCNVVSCLSDCSRAGLGDMILVFRVLWEGMGQSPSPHRKSTNEFLWASHLSFKIDT